MCYHTESPKKEKLREILPPEIIISDYPELPFANGFDHPQLPVIINAEPHLVQPITWDFTPPNQKFSFAVLNARSETVFESKLFGDSARHRRCLVFVQGFFEWSEVGGSKKKKPYYISRNDGKPFAMGGIWKDWGHGLKSTSIITTAANKMMTELRPENPRMTLILDPNKWDGWLNVDATELQVKDLMKTYKDGELMFTALDKSPLKRS